nr:leukemia virus cell receptor [Bos taurus]
MPENALPSDEDDKDPNDPYRALDIDLDKPLADSEKLPVQKHRNAETSKSPEKEDVPLVEKKSKKPKKKEKKHKEKEREKKKKEVEKGEDLDFWLSTTPPAATPALEELEVNTTVTVLKEGQEEPRERNRMPKRTGSRTWRRNPPSTRRRNTRKTRRSGPRTRGSPRRRCHQRMRRLLSPWRTAALEEEPLPPMSSYILLAENSYIKMTYDVQGSLQKDSQVTVSVVLENQSDTFLKSMELNVLDSLNARLARPEGSSVHDGVPVPFQLPPGISNEAQFVFTIQSIVMAQKLKGTLSFIAKNDEGSTHEKLDFKLHFTCTSYLVTTPCYSDAFAKLLESGDLSMSSIKVDGISMSFHNLLAKICFHHRFSVVERVDSCASMYSRSIQGHHVCLLVKKGEKSVSVDGKCSDPTLLSNLLEEMKETSGHVLSAASHRRAAVVCTHWVQPGLTKSTIVHCVDLAVHVALIYLVIFFYFASLYSLASSPCQSPSQPGLFWLERTVPVLWGLPEGERDRYRGLRTSGGWMGTTMLLATSVKSSESMSSRLLPLGLSRWRPWPAAWGDIPLHPTPRGTSSPGHTMGQSLAGCRPSHPVCSTTVSCSAEGSAQRGPGPWPPCPAACCGEWWRATALALLSSLDALQVCVCTCGRAWVPGLFPCWEARGSGGGWALRCTSGAGGEPTPRETELSSNMMVLNDILTSFDENCHFSM